MSGPSSGKIIFSDSKIAILNTKPQRVAPIYFKTLARSSSLLISLRSICRACKSTSQRKLESWHTGSIFYVSLNSSLLISLRSICRACKSTSQRKLESWHTGTILEVPRFIYCTTHKPIQIFGIITVVCPKRSPGADVVGVSPAPAQLSRPPSVPQLGQDTWYVGNSGAVGTV